MGTESVTGKRDLDADMLLCSVVDVRRQLDKCADNTGVRFEW